MWYYFFHTHNYHTKVKQNTHVRVYRMEFHIQQLAKHCRVCGRRLSKAKGRSTAYTCTAYKDQLLACYGVDVSKDNKDTHPLQFCNPCYIITKRLAKASHSRVPYTFATSIFVWTQHTHNCLVSFQWNVNSEHFNKKVTHLGLWAF